MFHIKMLLKNLYFKVLFFQKFAQNYVKLKQTWKKNILFRVVSNSAWSYSSLNYAEFPYFSLLFSGLLYK